MSNLGNAKPSNQEIVAAMRDFSKQKISLGFFSGSSRNMDEQQKKLLHRPPLQTFGLAVLAILGFVLFEILTSTAFDIPEFITDNYLLLWVVFLGVLAAFFKLLTLGAKYDERRLALFCKANSLIQVPSGTSYSGDLRDGFGTDAAFTGFDSAGKCFSFGRINGWFDKDHKPPTRMHGYSVDPNADVESLLFVRVEADGLNQQLQYFSPDRPVSREQLANISEKGFQAVSSLARQYAVVVGEGAIIVSGAAGSLNSVADSLLIVDLSLESRWKLMQRLIGGKLADAVEGLI
ncbi:MAG: hypothetical protein RLZZ380_1278 [Actinomycetota bacterium]|jgi:hypothetical protein